MWVLPWPFTPTQATRTVSFALCSVLARRLLVAAAVLIRKYLRFIKDISVHNS
jgi:hypothetical protein